MMRCGNCGNTSVVAKRITSKKSTSTYLPGAGQFSRASWRRCGRWRWAWSRSWLWAARLASIRREGDVDTTWLVVERLGVDVITLRTRQPTKFTIARLHRDSPPLSPVGQAKKLELPFAMRLPLHPTVKPGYGVAPTSHWSWVVGGVRLQLRPWLSVMARQKRISRSFDKSAVSR